MVREVKIKDNDLFACEECGFAYIDKETAEDCEDFCKKYNACSREIIAHAVTSVKIKR